MALSLRLVLAGNVSSTTVRLFANGVEVPLVAGAYETEVPVVNGIVALTSVDAAGRESVRTVQVTTAGGVAG